MGAGESGVISFPCARCRATVSAAAGQGGRRGRCRHCGTIQIIPEATPGYALAEVPPVMIPAPRPIAPAAAGGAAGRRKRALPGWFHASAREPSVLEAEIVALILLSLADLLVTYHLLKRGPSFYESNPVAQFFFARWNIAGMAIFKFSLVGFVVVVGEVAERRRPGLGRLVVLIGCVASLAVVGYGVRLALNAG